MSTVGVTVLGEAFKQTNAGQALTSLSTSYMNLGFGTLELMAHNATAFFLTHRNLLVHFASSAGGELVWVPAFIEWLEQRAKTERRK